MLRRFFSRFLPTIILGFFGLAGCSSDQAQDLILLIPIDGEQRLKVEYRSAHPTEAIALSRNPDSIRKERWHFTSPDFEISQFDDTDMIHRSDGAHFSSVEILVPATYVPLPKDYAPFSPFSDGGFLVHSGRFHACPSTFAGGGEDCAGPWLMQIHAPPNGHLLLNGKRHDDLVQWSDSGDGTKVYVGQAVPRQSVDFIGIVDPELPSTISGTMAASLPELMSYYGQRLPELARRPMLFVSYDRDYEKGHGRQGGTLPNQVFMHFYGPTWEQTDTDGVTLMDTVWFFAHEAGHIYQQGKSGNRESSWIHEGAAEAFAYLALKDLDIASESYLDSRRQQALDGCRTGLEQGSLATAAERGRFSDYYHCGLIIFLAIDKKIRANSDSQQDLFDFWAATISVSGVPVPLTAPIFLSKAEPWIGSDLAGQIVSISIEEQANIENILAQLGD